MPVPGEPAPWSVTWLPGRALTRDQGITAMTIVETFATYKGRAEQRSVSRRPGESAQQISYLLWDFILTHF
jgi:hypothetical protein